jgi:glutamate formiminotransferase/formiminotetrahydrofolate cyclodeaminase
MTHPLVECIPNYSDARRPEVIEAILQSISAVEGVHILDRHSDMDHNRTVVTLMGPPAAVEEAAFQSIATAAKLIDLDHHTGEHPRMGATDVVPFVPLQGMSMQECVEMARRLGKRVGTELGIPVYLYEEAATRPDRQNLENIRHGQYEALKEEMGVNPERKPDFGPERVGSAGATVIGARQPLIAFNVYLTTDNVSTAQKIARAVRFSNGGLRFVKAMGVLVEGRAQVSMNLTNYTQTPIPRVVEMVIREAARFGVSIHHTELVGMIPQTALIDAAIWYLQLDGFEYDQLLEGALRTAVSAQAATSAGETGQNFIEQLAAASPTPGGGSAAAHAGSAAAALVSMVCRLTTGKKKYAAVEARMWTILELSESLRAELTTAIAEDSASFDTYMVAAKLPKDTPEQQSACAEAMQKASLGAAVVPLNTARKVLKVMALALEVAEVGNLNAISDASTGFALGRAALTGAGLNIRTNLKGLQASTTAQAMLVELETIENLARELATRLSSVLNDRAGLPLPY